MQRFATLTLWDAYNLEPRSRQFVELSLKEASPHYRIYDRGSCLVATPADLFSHDRTLEDALQTARAASREVYQRGWGAVELAGFNKMVRASWVEIQILAHKYGKPLNVLYYEPTAADHKLYQMQEQIQPRLGKTF
jgi:hypothetical protein